MTTYFVDTSALGRRYLSELGSAWVQSWITPATGHIIVISELATVELNATLARLQRQNYLTTNAAIALQSNFLMHVEHEYLTVPFDSQIISRARLLVGQYKLRTLDALQLASAIEATVTLNESMVFVSGDNDLLAAAQAEGFVIDNPYSHP